MDRNSLKQLIRDRGFTYQKIADEIGITAQGVSEVVNGRSESAGTRYAIASILGLHPRDIWPLRDREVA